MIEPKHGRDMPSGRRIAVLIALALLALRKQTIDAIRIGALVPNAYRSLYSLFVPLSKEIERELLAGAKYTVEERGLLSDSDSRNPKKVGFAGEIESQVQSDGTSTVGIDNSAGVTQVTPKKAGVPYGTPASLGEPYGSPEVRTGPHLTDWAKAESQRRAMALIREMADTTTRAVNAAIEAGTANGEPPSRILANIFGMPAPMTIQERVAELNVFDRDRANRIAQNTAIDAMHAGQYEMGRDLGGIGTVWHTSSNPCKLCEPLDGQKRLYGEPYFIHSDRVPEPWRVVYYPTLHINCVCSVSTWWPS